VTRDATAPTASFTTTPTTPTSASTLTYGLTFSESVSGLIAGDFTRTGTATGCVVGTPTGSGAAWSVDVTGCSDGTVVLTLDANTVSDAAANAGPASPLAAATVTRDATPPTAGVIAPVTPTNAATLTYDVVFGEPVTGLEIGDFTKTGTATGCVVGTPSGSGQTWTVDVTGCSEGTVDLALNPNTVIDAAGNAGPASTQTAATVTRDTTAPSVTITPPATPTNAATLSYGITFSEPVFGFDALDVTTGSGTATGCTVDAPTGSGTSWTVTLSGCSEGTVTFSLHAAGVTDQAGNPGPAAQADAPVITVIYDSTAPTFTTPISVVLRPGASLSTASKTSAVPVTVSWLAVDDAAGSGLDHYTLERSITGGAWTPVPLPTPLTTSLATTVPTSGTVAYRVEACDVLANCTVVWSATGTLSPRITQQSSTAVKYRGTWSLSRSSTVSAGTIKYSRARNAYTTYTFTGRGIGFVAVKSSIRGYVKVYIDNKYRGQVNLYKTGATQVRLLAWQTVFATSGKHTIKLVVAGTARHPRVDIDAFVVMK
jgi:hypothetical protein